MMGEPEATLYPNPPKHKPTKDPNNPVTRARTMMGEPEAMVAMLCKSSPEETGRASARIFCTRTSLAFFIPRQTPMALAPVGWRCCWFCFFWGGLGFGFKRGVCVTL